MKIKIGITGGIGSGKSVVSRLLEAMGIPVYISDDESKRLTATDPDIRKCLVELLGGEVFEGGELNKPFLASYLFGNPEHARAINRIIHPRVKDDFRSWMLRHPDAEVVAMESAILLEAGFRSEVDVLIMVYAPAELRIERAMNRDSVSREAVISRMRHQMDDEEKALQADFVILNDDKHLLIPQVEGIVSKLFASLRCSNQQ